ncbi:VOC family protein, partial [Bradyrhizobium sp. Pear76]|uniref:VOC family protein n=1 Tax=Bradyrhizobium oropedii TaxID=1571201 RepID=UPI001E42714E
FFYFDTAPDAVPGITTPRVNLGEFVPGQPQNYVTAVGSMHHIAFNVEPDALLEYKRRLEDAGIYVSKVLGHYDEDRRTEDRQSGNADGTWLRSIYFRDPDGIGLEFACWDRPLRDGDVSHQPASSGKPSRDLHKTR